MMSIDDEGHKQPKKAEKRHHCLRTTRPHNTVGGLPNANENPLAPSHEKKSQ